MTTLLEIYESALEYSKDWGVEPHVLLFIAYAELQNQTLSESDAKLILKCHNKYMRIIESEDFNGEGQDAYWHLIEKPLNDRENEGR